MGLPGTIQKRYGFWRLYLKEVIYRYLECVPKILRRFFLHDRKLLAALSRWAWESLKRFLQGAIPDARGIPGSVVATQTFGEWPEARKNWTRLIQKVYEADPLVRSHCQGRRKVIPLLLTSHTMGLGFLTGLHFSKPLLLVTDSSVSHSRK